MICDNKLNEINKIEYYKNKDDVDYDKNKEEMIDKNKEEKDEENELNNEDEESEKTPFSLMLEGFAEGILVQFGTDLLSVLIMDNDSLKSKYKPELSKYYATSISYGISSYLSNILNTYGLIIVEAVFSGFIEDYVDALEKNEKLVVDVQGIVNEAIIGVIINYIISKLFKTEEFSKNTTIAIDIIISGIFQVIEMSKKRQEEINDEK